MCMYTTLTPVIMPAWLLRSYDNMAGFMEQLQQVVDEAAEDYLRDFERIVADVSYNNQWYKDVIVY